MTQTDLQPQIDELRKMLAKATPGPWKPTLLDDVPDETPTHFYHDDQGERIHVAGWDIHELMSLGDGECGAMKEADAKLVVALRNSAGALLDAAERGEHYREVALAAIEIVRNAGRIGDAAQLTAALASRGQGRQS